MVCTLKMLHHESREHLCKKESDERGQRILQDELEFDEQDELPGPQPYEGRPDIVRGNFFQSMPARFTDY